MSNWARSGPTDTSYCLLAEGERQDLGGVYLVTIGEPGYKGTSRTFHETAAIGHTLLHSTLHDHLDVLDSAIEM